MKISSSNRSVMNRFSDDITVSRGRQRVQSLLFVKMGLGCGGGGDRVVTNDINNPTSCQLVVANKIDIQKQNSQYRYAERIKGAVKVTRAETTETLAMSTTCSLWVSEELDSLVQTLASSLGLEKL